MHFTLWNYNPLNDNLFGDHWNGEDFSIFSPFIGKTPRSMSLRDTKRPNIQIESKTPMAPPMEKAGSLARSQSTGSIQIFSEIKKKADPFEIDKLDDTFGPRSKRRSAGSPHHPPLPDGQFELTDFYFEDEINSDPDHHVGGRALDAVIRPYAAKVSGKPRVMRFDYKTQDFFLEFSTSRTAQAESLDVSTPEWEFITEIFIPEYQYGDQRLRVSVSDGVWSYDKSKETLYWKYDKKHSDTIGMDYSILFDDDSLFRIFMTALWPLLYAISILFFTKPWHQTQLQKDEILHWIHVCPAPASTIGS